MSSLSVQYYQGAQGLSQIYDDWLALVNELPRPHFNQHPDWYAAYFEALEPPVEALTFCAAYEGARLVGVLPAMHPSDDGERRTKGAGAIRRVRIARDLGIYTTDLIVRQGSDPGQVWRCLRGAMRRGPMRWDVFVAPEVVPGQQGLAQALGQGGFWVVSDRRPGCRVASVRPHAEMIAGLKKKFRYNLRHSERLLGQLGESDYSWHEATAMDAPFEAFLALEQAGWKGRADAAKAGYPAPAAIGLEAWKTAFYRRVVNRFAERNAVRLLLLRLAGDVIGAQITIHLGQSEYLLKTAMSESLDTRISLGHLMVDRLIRRIEQDNETLERPIDELNFLTDYSWSTRWGTQERAHLSYRAYNATPLGIISALRRHLTNT